LLSSAYLIARMFAGMQKVREDIPYLRLPGATTGRGEQRRDEVGGQDGLFSK